MLLEYSWHKKRTYLHFDQPISIDNAIKLVESPDKIASHPFYPSINFIIKTRKFKFNKETNKLETVIKNRKISYSSHVDSYIYAYYSQLLSNEYEIKLKELNLDKNILAFRKLGKSNIDFAKMAFDEIKSRKSCVAIGLDITKYFDELNHLQLKKSWQYILETNSLPPDHFNIYKSITRYSEVNKTELYKLLKIPLNNPRNGRHKICSSDTFRKTVRRAGIINQNKQNKGIPQGSPISALLSNIYLIKFDSEVNQLMDAVDGKYLRYCDDILCIVPVNNKDEIIDCLLKKISEYYLEINQNKKEIRTFHTDSFGNLISDKPLQYLGFLFDGQRILIRNAALSRYSERMKSSVYLYGKAKLNSDKIRLKHGLPPSKFYRSKLYKKYGYVGRRNFISYAYKAAKIMDSESIRKQIRPLWNRLLARIEQESEKIEVIFQKGNSV
ncbi:MAG: reverse transcriptase domain-containing protein [Desulfuromonadaceae bacterium]|nr:reverse transcriptase domain-containing protein [Desulfuromonadaceae bacterium]